LFEIGGEGHHLPAGAIDSLEHCESSRQGVASAIVTRDVETGIALGLKGKTCRPFIGSGHQRRTHGSREVKEPDVETPVEHDPHATVEIAYCRESAVRRREKLLEAPTNVIAGRAVQKE
jgi:hypothetical protein